MYRRDLLKAGAAVAAGLLSFPLGWAADAPKRRILMFTKSGTYQHDVVKRKDDHLAPAEQIVTDLGGRHGFEVTCTQDGRVFDEDLGKYDGFLFETQGDLTTVGVDKQPAVSAAGKKALLKAIAAGKGFVGCHCASDTCHSPGDSRKEQPRDQVDPYIAMLGGEFIVHGAQQEAWMRVADHHFPGTKGLMDFRLLEEWYCLKNFAPDLHVILVQDTEGMKGKDYQRPPYPATWARRHHKGRVFFTSMGHREDVWRNETFQQLLLGGLAWTLRNVDADIPPNLQQVTPKAHELPA